MNAAFKLNQTIQVFALQLERVVSSAKTITEGFAEFWKDSFLLTPLQYTLLQVLLLLLLGTTVLIWYSWSVYGKVITEKFVRPSTLKEIEELKLSVAKLKLPKEHSPRI